MSKASIIGNLTKLILPGQSSKFKAAIFDSNKAIILSNEGRLQTANSPDSDKFEDLYFSPSIYSRNAITKHHANFESNPWDKFLTYLNPTVAKNLKPNSEHRRQLIDSYNLCLDQKDSTATRNLSGILGSQPLLRHLSVNNDFDVEEQRLKREDCWNDVVEGKLSPAVILKKYYNDGEENKWASDGLFLRMALMNSDNSLFLVKRLGELLSKDIKDDDKFKLVYGSRVAKIPHSDNDPKSFEDMNEVFQYISGIDGFNDKTKCNLLVNVGENWEKNKNSLYENSILKTDFIKSFAKDFVVPKYLTEISKSYAEAGQDVPEIFSVTYVNRYPLMVAERIVAEKMSENLDVKKLKDLSDKYAINRPMIEKEKPLIKQYSSEKYRNYLMQWYEVVSFEEIEKYQKDVNDGYCYKVLTNESQLIEEGTKLDNCLGGFGEICKNGKSHIIAGTSPNGENFTLEIGNGGANPKENSPQCFYLKQLSTLQDYECSQETQDAAKRFIDAMNSGKIKTCSKAGAIDIDEEITDLKSWLKFNPDDPQENDAVFQAYKNTNLLPKQWLKYESVDEMMSKSGINKAIEIALEMDAPKKPSPSIFNIVMNSLFGDKNKSNNFSR